MPANMPATIGRYTLAGEIGRGAMGVVYKAADPALERTVAIKTVGLDLDPAEREQYEKRFITEARAAGGLNHPNIVVIHDIGKSGELAFIAMEYLEGRELKELIATRELSADRALDIAAQVADALAYAHRRDVVHRDVKPANIMILTDGRVKITDFGIARMRSSDVRSPAGVVVGSPRYLSPEQVLGKRSDARADSFALGVILYEMLTGDVPFNGIDVNALMFQIVHFNPPPPSHINPALPAVIDLIIAKALAKNPDDRYADIGEFAADMKQARLPGLADVYVPAAAGPGVMTAQPLSETWIETLPSGRTGDFDIIQAAEPPPTLGLARGFDSMAASMRLAAKTSTLSEPHQFAASFGFSRQSVDAALREAARIAASMNVTIKPEVSWSRADWHFFWGGVSAATVAGCLMVFA